MFKNCNAIKGVTGGEKVQLMVNMFRLFTLGKRHGTSLMELEKSKVFSDFWGELFLLSVKNT